MYTTRALALVTLLAAVGCTKHQTEMILVITTEGVRIPDDVHSLHLHVADRQGSGDDPVYDADVALCNPTLTTTCYDLPVTAVLYPGPSRGNDSVRVQVTANGATGPVIDDAALFTFASEQSLRLDFVLYANCLGNVECAKRDQACGPLDTCIDLKPGPGNGPLDLAMPGPPDLAGCGQLNQSCCPASNGARSGHAWANVLPEMGAGFPDMAMDFPDMAMSLPVPDLSMPPGPDLSVPPDDLATPPPSDDLATPPPADLATGPTGICDPGLRCVSSVCVP